MYEIQCFDIDGNLIKNFYQWDVNQKIIVDCDNFNITPNTAPPIIRFSNNSMDYAIPVQSNIEDKKLVVDIPNYILMMPLPVNISFYFSSFKDITSKRTLLTTTIPVRRQKQPLDYSYEENIKNYIHYFRCFTRLFYSSTNITSTSDRKFALFK